VFRDLRGIAIATHNRRSYNLLFDSLYPDAFPLIHSIIEVWYEDIEVCTAVLKFLQVHKQNNTWYYFCSYIWFITISIFISFNRFCFLIKGILLQQRTESHFWSILCQWNPPLQGGERATLLLWDGCFRLTCCEGYISGEIQSLIFLSKILYVFEWWIFGLFDLLLMYLYTFCRVWEYCLTFSQLVWLEIMWILECLLYMKIRFSLFLTYQKKFSIIILNCVVGVW